MVTRRAECSCGRLSATCSGEPVRISVCHCLACKRRSGSAFSYNARFAEDKVTFAGRSKAFTRIGDEGGQVIYSFCPKCGDHGPLPDRHTARRDCHSHWRFRRSLLPAAFRIRLSRQPALFMGRDSRGAADDGRLSSPQSPDELAGRCGTLTSASPSSTSVPATLQRHASRARSLSAISSITSTSASTVSPILTGARNLSV